MEAPEKLYIHKSQFWGLMANEHNITKDDIEYTRTDAFIEKACKFLDKELPITDLSPLNMLDITFKVFDKESKRVFIEDFKNYMKGE
jgi:hypothetical protein